MAIVDLATVLTDLSISWPWTDDACAVQHVLLRVVLFSLPLCTVPCVRSPTHPPPTYSCPLDPAG
jgi:hypothetical protein